ncbi:hypothetical protein HYN59_07730 [Flavobacterium album]|uniref:Lipocalin-like domain-containing protein n=1 Tax=Flavobacterium album TaxID=2175091 RepID=A0A2S1QXQ6_9FLAO|nr:hypothetical protein [Flavobacterium album]AWH85021.1 hypothetical protein HYN59_07730 [Flavobacterium album]
MNKTFYIFILFLFSASAFAQKVTEKELIGTWNLTAFETNGMTINYKTYDIILSPEMKKKYGDKAEAFQKKGSDELKKNKPKAQELFFEDGTKVFFRKEGEEPLSWHYLLFEKEGVQYLKMNGGDFKITRDGKAIVLAGKENNGNQITMTYEKAT